MKFMHLAFRHHQIFYTWEFTLSATKYNRQREIDMNTLCAHIHIQQLWQASLNIMTSKQ